jgi:hypothetical protein
MPAARRTAVHSAAPAVGGAVAGTGSRRAIPAATRSSGRHQPCFAADSKEAPMNKMKRKTLSLTKERLATLTTEDLHNAAGGITNITRHTQCVANTCIGFTDICGTTF